MHAEQSIFDCHVTDTTSSQCPDSSSLARQVSENGHLRVSIFISAVPFPFRPVFRSRHFPWPALLPVLQAAGGEEALPGGFQLTLGLGRHQLAAFGVEAGPGLAQGGPVRRRRRGGRGAGNGAVGGLQHHVAGYHPGFAAFAAGHHGAGLDVGLSFQDETFAEGNVVDLHGRSPGVAGQVGEPAGRPGNGPHSSPPGGHRKGWFGRIKGV